MINNPRIIFGICIIWISQCLSHSEFVIQGTATLNHVKGVAKHPITFGILLEVRNAEYRITANGLGDEWFNNQIVAGDETHNYILEQSWPSLESKKANKDYKEFGQVGAGAFPEFSPTPVQLVWLAYCSRSFLTAGTNDLKWQLYNTKYAPANGVKQIVFMSKTNSGQIDKIQCIAGSTLYASMQKSNITLKAPYDKGYLLWEIKITSYTNIGKSTWPLTFEYEQYHPNIARGKTSDDLEHIYSGRFVATNIIEADFSGSMLPAATMKDVPVADWSHHLPSTGQGTPVVPYVLNGDKWKPSTDPGIQNQVLAIRQTVRLREPPQERMGVRVVVVAFLGASFLLLCWFIIREVKKSSNQTKNK